MKTESAADIVAPTSVAALATTLDYDAAPNEGDALAPLWHWIFFRPIVRQSLIAEDGHPRKGSFLPELGLPRRMWAGGRLRFPAPVIVGERITRESSIFDVSEKQGRTGKLGFVTVGHRICCGDVTAIEEEHDIVYREPAAPGAPAPAPTAAPRDARWQRDIVPDEALLLRYSALTFNAHRIHYDKPIVRSRRFDRTARRRSRTRRVRRDRMPAPALHATCCARENAGCAPSPRECSATARSPRRSSPRSNATRTRCEIAPAIRRACVRAAPELGNARVRHRARGHRA
ncbi:acyl-CoA dehydrogenase [Caballeronia turbans]|nr:acyl-CoA dehydrogenase [Caballeronia turbans]